VTLSLRTQAALAQYVVEVAHAGVFATDGDLRVTMWNRWMEMQTRRSAQETVGQPLFSLFPDLAARGFDVYYGEALAQGVVTTLSHALHNYIIAMPATHPDLGALEMAQSGRIAPIRDGGEIVGTITLIENVSERLAAELELRKQILAQEEARAAAEAALRAKDEFLSTLSHELRTPLNAVLGWTRIVLTREETNPQNVRALQIIERNAAAQAAMIDDILDVARIVSGKLRLETAPADLMQVALAAVDVIAPAAAAKRITVRTELEDAVPTVLGDSGRLQQIVWNLLSNAVKFSDAGGEIVVRLGTAGDRVRLSVGDRGRGIPAEFLPFVFDRFRQSDVSSARRQGGLGLGLALVKDLVQLHGGMIAVESGGEGQGAVFTIELPVLADTPVAVHAPAAPAGDAGVHTLSGIRILVVEDESDSRELLHNLLARFGATVVAVASADEALARLADDSAAFDVLLSDIGMPGHDGYELIRRIRSLPSSRAARIPAVAVTGYATPGDLERASTAGYNGHLAKPIDPAALAVEVVRAINAVPSE